MFVFRMGPICTCGVCSGAMSRLDTPALQHTAESLFLQHRGKRGDWQVDILPPPPPPPLSLSICRTHMHTHPRTHTDTHTYTHTRAHIHRHTCAHTHTLKRAHKHKYTHIPPREEYRCFRSHHASAHTYTDRGPSLQPLPDPKQGEPQPGLRAQTGINKYILFFVLRGPHSLLPRRAVSDIRHNLP